MTPDQFDPQEAECAARIHADTTRILRRLCEPGAVLAVAENMERGVVVRSDDSGLSTRTAVVEPPVAHALALNGWINCPKPGRVNRYYITAAGRSALSRLLAESENRVRAERETGAPELAGREAREGDGRRQRRARYNASESPLIALARRRDRDGTPFLDETLVRAGERLREDFELAQMGPRIGQNWERFLTGGTERGTSGPESPIDRGPDAAGRRVREALVELGPGLSDVALRCCCFLEGLETAEKRLGWSARSGKIVLRIALQRLKRHYDAQRACDRLIG